MSLESRRELEAMLAESEAELARGEPGIPAEVVLAELRREIIGRG
jgi:hypothetical protein